MERRPSDEFHALTAASRSVLAARMRLGEKPDPAALTGWEYRGLLTAAPARAARLARFVKGFVGAPAATRGYNRLVAPGSPERPWLSRSGRGEPPPIAFFAVRPAEPGGRYHDALLLDYSGVPRAPLNPIGRVRDYLVRAEPGSDDLLVGHAFVAVVSAAEVALTFFVLERLRPVPAGGRGTRAED